LRKKKKEGKRPGRALFKTQKNPDRREKKRLPPYGGVGLRRAGGKEKRGDRTPATVIS